MGTPLTGRASQLRLPTYRYDSNGNLERTEVSGANVDPRTTTASNFAAARFPETVTNALEHAETLVWDVALGLPTRVGDANAPYHTGDARHFERHAYDVRGRPTSLERAGGGGGPNGDIHPVVTPWGWERR